MGKMKQLGLVASGFGLTDSDHGASPATAIGRRHRTDVGGNLMAIDNRANTSSW